MTPEEMQEEIDRLRQQLYLANESATSSSAHAARLRAAIKRVRALHTNTHGLCDGCFDSNELAPLSHPSRLGR